MSKPTLHEIAAMPFPKSVEAMRAHYVKDWAKPIPEGISEKRKFRVKVEYEVSYSDSETVEVEAWTTEDAEELAAERVAKEVEREANSPFAYAEVTGTEVLTDKAAQ